MRKENYKRYGAGGPKKIVEPKWVKDLPKDGERWTMEQEMAYFNWSSIYSRRGYSEQEWDKIHEERQRIKDEEFLEIAGYADYNGEDILMVLKKKLEWQIDYFENFGHLESNLYKASQMRLCCRLIDIVCWGGMTGEYRLKLGKYVNMRNAHRFDHVPDRDRSYLGGERQRVRYKKAYSLLFKVLFQNIMKWWD